MNIVFLILLLPLHRSGSGRPQYLELGVSSETDEDSDGVVLQKESKESDERTGKDVKGVLKKIPDKKAALVEMKIRDKETNKTKTQTFLHLPSSFQYTITNCFCGGNCQEIHTPNVWKCNDTCRRICGTACTICGTRQV